FDAEHQRLDLPIGADLAAADEAILAERVVRAGKRVAPGGTGEAGAEIAADIDSRPVIDRWCVGDRGHRCGPARRRQIGGLRRTNGNASGNNRARGERNAADERTRIHADLQPLFPHSRRLRGASHRALRSPSSWTTLLDKAWSSNGWKMAHSAAP